jgi:hypothetical protein
MPSPAQLRAEIACAVRYGDTERATAARREYYTEQLAGKIKATVDLAPQLTTEQIERLRSLLPVPASHTREAA